MSNDRVGVSQVGERQYWGRLVTAALVATSLLTVGCDPGGGEGSEEETVFGSLQGACKKKGAQNWGAGDIELATVRLEMEGAPAGGIEEVWLEVDQVAANHKALGWLELSEGPQVIALHGPGSAGDGGVDLGQWPVGKYKGVRLRLADSWVVVDGEIVPLKVPSGKTSGLKLKAKGPISVESCATTTLSFDWSDAGLTKKKKKKKWKNKSNNNKQVSYQLCASQKGTATIEEGTCEPEPESDPQLAAMDALAAASERPLELRFEAGIPVFAAFQVPVDPDVPADDPVLRALEFLETYQDLYRLESPKDQLVLSRLEVEEDGTEHVFFQQRQGNWEVMLTDIGVHMSDGSVWSTAGHWLADLPISTEPSVDAATAIEAGLQALLANSPTHMGQAKLAVYDPRLEGEQGDAARLAWRLYFRGFSGADQSATAWEVFVDATTAQVLRVFDLAETHDTADYKIETANNTDPGVCWDFSFDLTRWFDENGPVAAYPGGPSNFPGGDADGDSAFLASDTIWNYFHDAHGLHGWNGDSKELDAKVHVGTAWRNAAYRSWCDHLVFGDGIASPGIIAHEFRHAVDRYSADLRYQNQSGALDESYADISAAVIDDEDWFIGEDLGLGGCGALRDMADPPNCGDPDHMDDYFVTTGDNGGVHTNSSIHNKAAFLMSEGGLHNDVVVVGMGREKMSQVTYATHTTRLTSGSQFMDARVNSVEQARDFVRRGLHGFSDSDVCTVQNAFASVGLGAADQDCDGVFDSEDTDLDGDYVLDSTDNCVPLRNPRQDDADGDGIGDPCDDDIDGDAIPNGEDNCPLIANPGQEDVLTPNGIGDVCDDVDADGRPDAFDNCLTIINSSQSDIDGDGAGDACDGDIDNDGFINSEDLCPLVPTIFQSDTDGDGVGTFCDNCPGAANAEQSDLDDDGIGDACDSDGDGDGLPNEEDNCPQAFNPDQIDLDNNGQGTACDSGEATMLGGNLADTLVGLLDVFDPNAALQIPISPCLADGCPNWLGGAVTDVMVTTMMPVRVRVVDDRGFVVGSAVNFDNNGIFDSMVDFGVAPDFHYSAAGAATFSGDSYFLEIGPFDQFQPGTQLPIEISIFTEL